MLNQIEEISSHLIGNWNVLGKQLVYFLAVAAVLFFIIARKINPFSISPRKNTRSRVRYARYIAFSLIQSSIVLFVIGGVTPQKYVYFCLLMASFIIVPATIGYCATWFKIRKSVLQGSVQKKQLSELSNA